MYHSSSVQQEVVRIGLFSFQLQKNNKGCVSKSNKLMDTVTCLECDKNPKKMIESNKKERNYVIYQLMALTMNCQAFL